MVPGTKSIHAFLYVVNKHVSKAETDSLAPLSRNMLMVVVLSFFSFNLFAMTQEPPPVLKLLGECYPQNSWYETWNNGTIFKGNGLHALLQFQSKFASGIEIVTDVSTSNLTHPVVTLYFL